jgi:cytochrome c oxidase assembly protein subunit 11
MTRAHSHTRTVLVCCSIVLGMLGLAFASVPLYDLFCRVTGFGGTPMQAQKAPDHISAREITIRFDANVAPDLDWSFLPETPVVTAKLGQTVIITYTVRNKGTVPATGIATYNVSPEKFGAYFVKIACFCYTDHTLQPGESLQSQVVFYIDPALEKDREAQHLDQVTLSYTYMHAKAKPVASMSYGTEKPPL